VGDRRCWGFGSIAYLVLFSTEDGGEVIRHGGSDNGLNLTLRICSDEKIAVRIGSTLKGSMWRILRSLLM
jgi:hypothetical protein